METDAAAAIRAIDPGTIHQIQSGQVIVDLCSVAKELVENSLDACATTIDVRFKNQGLDSIEVQDNGGGISPDNYESIALKHYTSKLSTYEDLTTVQTFGFRGEALSSLCALSHFKIVTCLQSEVPKAKKLEFEASGKLKATTIVAGQRGTTASVENLFFNLPVRRRELERNIKREWGKVISLLNQYACVQTGVKISVWQQPNKGKRILLFSTKGNRTTRDNIINVFGAKTLAALIALDLRLDLEATQGPGSRSDDRQDKVYEIRIAGHISRPVHGGGRQTPDRQMFFVNGRPCGLPQFAKVFNEVYRSYNSSQSPFIFADIQLDTSLYDVNVSPDKRTILLHEQGKMLDRLRDKLVELFETQDYTVSKAEIMAKKQTPLRGASISSTDSPSLSRRIGELDMGRATATPDPGMTVAGSESDLGADDQGQDTSIDITEHHHADAPADDGDRNLSDANPHQHGQQHVSSEEQGNELAEGEEQSGEEVDDGGPASKHSNLPVPHSNAPSNSTLSRWLSNNGNSQPIAGQARPNLATISIGNETTTTSLANAAKRGRLDSAGSKGRSSKRVKKDTRQRALPSFGGRLSQMFASTSQTGNADARSEDAQRQEQDESDEAAADAGSGSDDEGPSQDEPSDDDLLSVEKYTAVEAAGATSDQDTETPPSGQSPRSNEIEERDGSEIAASVQHSEYAESDSEHEEGPTTDDLVKLAASKAEAETVEGEKRAQLLVKGGKRKDVTLQLLQRWRTDEQQVAAHVEAWQTSVHTAADLKSAHSPPPPSASEPVDPEGVLSLKISKSDFAKMQIIGQFNLGFVLAVRPASAVDDSVGDASQASSHAEDDLFIIDQHASDEKYNFERLQASTVVQSQRLVQPKVLELTAVEEEIVMENIPALEANGFVVQVDNTGTAPVGRRVQLLSLPLSRETTFTLADLEELIFLLGDNPSLTVGSGAPIPRPSRTRKMFAMRACRSSIMIGRALSLPQMHKVVRHMGEMEKPWNCPHGRPTMRHLCGLGSWDEKGWREDGPDDEKIDWAAYVCQRR